MNRKRTNEDDQPRSRAYTPAEYGHQSSDAAMWERQSGEASSVLGKRRIYDNHEPRQRSYTPAEYGQKLVPTVPEDKVTQVVGIFLCAAMIFEEGGPSPNKAQECIREAEKIYEISKKVATSAAAHYANQPRRSGVLILYNLLPENTQQIVSNSLSRVGLASLLR